MENLGGAMQQVGDLISVGCFDGGMSGLSMLRGCCPGV